MGQGTGALGYYGTRSCASRHHVAGTEQLGAVLLCTMYLGAVQCAAGPVHLGTVEPQLSITVLVRDTGKKQEHQEKSCVVEIQHERILKQADLLF